MAADPESLIGPDGKFDLSPGGHVGPSEEEGVLMEDPDWRQEMQKLRTFVHSIKTEGARGAYREQESEIQEALAMARDLAVLLPRRSEDGYREAWGGLAGILGKLDSAIQRMRR